MVWMISTVFWKFLGWSSEMWESDWLAVLLAILTFGIVYLLYQRTKKAPIPRVLYSDLHDLAMAPSLRPILAQLPKILLAAALALFLIGFIDLHQMVPLSTEAAPAASGLPPREGIALYIVADHSGSMQEQITIRNTEGFSQKVTKIKMLKEVTAEFIEGRPNDLIGLITFARAAQVLAPLTLDHQIILDELKKLEIVKDPAQDGTSIGYALYKAASLITATRHFAQELIKEGKSYYDIKHSVIILVTDGLQDPSKLDYGNPLRTMEPEDAAAYAKQQNIRIYIINVDPSFNTAEFLPQRHVMQRTAESTGGKFFMFDGATNLQEVFDEINQIEKSRIKQNLPSSLFQRVSFYPYMVALGLLCLLLGCLLESTWLRQSP